MLRVELLILALALAFSGTLYLSPVLPGQEASLELEFAADPSSRGPGALTWFREQAMAKLPHWPRQLPVNGRLHLGLQLPYRLRAEKGTSELGGDYFRATLRVRGVGILEGSCDFEGREQWSGRGLRPPTGRLAHLARLAGLDRPGPVSLDAAAFVGNLLAGLGQGNRQTWLLGLGPAHCAVVDVATHRDRGQGGQWQIRTRGPSAGGILFPATLALLADLRGRPQVGSLLEGPVANDLECWIAKAQACLGMDREEAARQLARYQDPRSRHCLERLLLSKDDTRLAAIAALAQLGAIESLPLIMDAGSADVPLSEEMAQAALRVLWSKATAQEREKVLASACPLPPSFRASRSVQPAPPGHSGQLVAVASAASVASSLRQATLYLLSAITLGLLLLLGRGYLKS